MKKVSYRTKWRESELRALRAMLEEGKSITEIADALERTYSAVTGRVHRLKIKKGNKKW